MCMCDTWGVCQMATAASEWAAKFAQLTGVAIEITSESIERAKETREAISRKYGADAIPLLGAYTWCHIMHHCYPDSTSVSLGNIQFTHWSIQAQLQEPFTALSPEKVRQIARDVFKLECTDE